MLSDRLEAREAAGRPVRVGVIGAGRFGTMVVSTRAGMRGMRPSVVADIDGARALRALAHAGLPGDVVVRAGTAAQANAAIARGEVKSCCDRTNAPADGLYNIATATPGTTVLPV